MGVVERPGSDGEAGPEVSQQFGCVSEILFDFSFEFCGNFQIALIRAGGEDLRRLAVAVAGGSGARTEHVETRGDAWRHVANDSRQGKIRRQGGRRKKERQQRGQNDQRESHRAQLE